MSRLPSATPAQIIRALKRAGFVEHHQQGSHLYLWNPETRHMTSVSRHSRELPRGTLKAIMIQAGFSEDEFHKIL